MGAAKNEDCARLRKQDLVPVYEDVLTQWEQKYAAQTLLGPVPRVTLEWQESKVNPDQK